MSLMDSLYSYMLTCPFLKEGAVGVDYLGAHHRSYSIEQVPGSTIVKQYSSGDSIRQLGFNFAGREPYGKSEAENLDNSAFYEQLGQWLEQQSRQGVLPELDEGQHAQSIEVLTGGYVLDTGTSEARYQIQCRLNYYQEG